MRLFGALLGVAALAACQPGGGAPERVRGDEVRPGEIEVSGLSHCDSARLELAAVVLNGPPKGESLEDVGDATAPGCTWVAMDGAARVRLNVYDNAMLAGARSHTEQFETLADAHAARSGAGVEVEGIGLRAARFGFSEATPETGVILVETDTAVLEFEGRAVSPAKLAIFARGVSENIAQPEE